MPRLQFSLRWLMVTITLACVVLFLWVTFGSFFDIVFASLMWCVVPTPLVIAAIYGRGDAQAFSIGGLVPWVSLVGLESPSFDSYLFAAMWLIPMCIICGLLAVATRRWL